MFVSRSWTIIFTTLILCSSELSILDAQFKNPFKRRSNTQNSSRELTVKDGPWLVMCTSFSGENAEQNARLLANDLSKQNLKTYIYRQSFDYSNVTTGIGWHTPNRSLQFNGRPQEADFVNKSEIDDLKPQPKRMRSANLSVVNEVAVLVGDFSSFDDHRAQKALKKIKNLSLENKIGHLSPSKHSDRSVGHNLVVGQGGPLRTAILVPNPMLPDEYFSQNRIDGFVMKLNKNKNIEHSLLDCPGLYSIRIARFRGHTTIDPNKIREGETELQALQSTGKLLTTSRLIEAENNAHVVTETLRKSGIEAYEFHDRSESIVCIGSFDWVTRETKDAVVNNPEIVRLVNSLRPEVKNLPGVPGAIIPKSIKGIALDPEPTPILVPKAQSTKAPGRLNFPRFSSR